MNREDAAREIDNTACCFSDKRFRDAMHMAAAALRGPQPDPETGLVPCGCGGKAKFRFGMDWKGRPDDSCFVICEECGEQSGTVCGECIARHFWNRAMSGGKDNG